MAEIPIIAIKDASNFPIPVTGYVSPYPTVVKVDTAHHIAAGMLVNTSGWALLSTKYIKVAEIRIKKTIILPRV